MKILPNYIEKKGLKPDAAISLKKNMNILSEEEAQVIADYMVSCLVIDEWLSPNQDPIDGSKWIPTRTWSDGIYFWKEDHIHFVREYRARLPRAFIEHVKLQIYSEFDASLLDKNALYRAYTEALESKMENNNDDFYDLSY